MYIEEIQGSARRNIQSDLLVNDIPITFKLDAGGECNVISLALANDLNAQVQPTSMLLKRECPLRPSHIENIWHMLKNQNFSYSSQRNPRVSLETWCDFFLEIFFLTRQKNRKSVTVPRLVKNTQIAVTNTLSKTSLCLIRIKITR